MLLVFDFEMVYTTRRNETRLCSVRIPSHIVIKFIAFIKQHIFCYRTGHKSTESVNIVPKIQERCYIPQHQVIVHESSCCRHCISSGVSLLLGPMSWCVKTAQAYMKTVKDVAVSLYSFHCKLVGTCLVLHLRGHFLLLQSST